MHTCRLCSGKLKRDHRSVWQRFWYLAVYECSVCHRDVRMPRFTYRLGEECCCPRCGTTKLSKLKERDRIDRMDSGMWNLLARVGGGKLYHCCFCRLQFYDRRPLTPAASDTPAVAEAASRLVRTTGS